MLLWQIEEIDTPGLRSNEEYLLSVDNRKLTYYRDKRAKQQLYSTVRDLSVLFASFLTAQATELIQKALILLNGCSVRFQMTACGTLLLKNPNSQWVDHPDIPFIPDAWQKEVIDLIDQ